MRFDRHDLIYRLRQCWFFSIFVVRRRRSRRHRRRRQLLSLLIQIKRKSKRKRKQKRKRGNLRGGEGGEAPLWGPP